MRPIKVIVFCVGVICLSVGSAKAAALAADWSDAGTDNPPVTVSVDTPAPPAAPTYSASGITIDMDEATPQAPRFGDAFSFSFNTAGASAFAVVEDKTYAAANPGTPNAEDIQSTSIADVTTEKLENGDIEISFDTTYAAKNLPADYQAFFKQTTAVGSVTIDYNPEADKNSNTNNVDSVSVDITVPEPGSLGVLGMVGLWGVFGRRNRPA